MKQSQIDQFFHHIARCDVLGAKPLTWAQFTWTADNAIKSRKTFLPDWLTLGA
jgi:hypothetical protein